MQEFPWKSCFTIHLQSFSTNPKILKNFTRFLAKYPRVNGMGKFLTFSGSSWKYMWVDDQIKKDKVNI